MDDRSSTLSAGSPDNTSRPYQRDYEFDYDDKPAPKPPVHLFRPMTCLSSPTNTSTAVYLCLPRTLSAPFIPASRKDSEPFASKFAREHSAFETLPNARMHTQLRLLEHPHVQEELMHRTKCGMSRLDERYMGLLGQCVVVKTSTSPTALRREADVTEHLHRGREYASLHIGSYILRSQITRSPSTSWLCMRPVFGPTLAAFGTTCANQNIGLPSWMVAHIFIGLLDAVAFVHADGYTHGNVEAKNVVLNAYPTYFHYRYRGYPDVQLIDFHNAAPITETDGVAEKDVKALLRVIQEMICTWSDVAPFLEEEGAAKIIETSDPIVLLLQTICGVLAHNEALTLDDLRREFGSQLEAIRHEGPQNMPWSMVKMLHADLATDEGMEDAVREPTVLKFATMREELRRLRDEVPVEMGPARHAGMRTNGILVIRFKRREAGFLRIVGEDDVREEDDNETEDTEMADDYEGGNSL